ncbi:DUF2894 domain-containing protein [Burkholderia stagnalis]|uniref:DUF2894 domain-containing protein n=1 Tax=Burkholderia stagnalis TaxID=1503054 RepID=A0ABX9YI70_9BURK|nr:DUF2894 domain-containing protein [Burkholderia stagnalis]RQQ58922.1 DUF2894 domain-containing protein [Burkholderia stagnalis]RQQ62784.1 DUF2894 domain-containing protein [Burkholderia stagnalis]RQQ63919.1 DUF2894 domain-containing protein [Burkholderia stagnalis]RQQ76906.1 DUF2894 domain-containing protein [Burkholderia stagnalis]RQQ83532.1 DUF2894 domain-containing protein [Burkholderia stagnalis]
MGSDATQARAMLDAWREQGADRLDPVRFHLMDALARRAAGHDGDARRLLDARLATLLAGYADIVERGAPNAADVGIPPGEPARGEPAPGEPARGEPARGALAALVAQLARDAQADRAGIDPAMIEFFRETWSKVRTEKQYRQALDQVPRNAGPLNSSSLVHRSLSLMRDLSPGYLQQFLSYVDALSWLEDLMGGGAQAEKEAPRAKGAKKAARGKTR